jgi:hypothetical protein
VCGNGRDDDCNGFTDEENAKDCVPYYRDDDEDRYGVTDDFKCLCAPKAPYSATSKNDCDDTKIGINPAATEVCNGYDDNCDDITDPPGSPNCSKFYKDVDGDTWGISGALNEQCLCATAAPFTAIRDGDCNDDNFDVNLGATEVCNGIDDNCINGIDEAGADDCVTYYRDDDRDEYGVAQDSRCTCAGAPPYDATKVGDCNDANNEVNPGVTEICNGIDDNCVAGIDEPNTPDCTIFYYDNDGDTWGVENTFKCLCGADGKYSASRFGDCNDSIGGINPNATEVCNNADDNCDGAVDEDGALNCQTLFMDVDVDSWGAIGSSRCLCPSNVVQYYTATRGLDCNDADFYVNPGRTEKCSTVGVDDNCNGDTDEENASDCSDYWEDKDKDGWGSLTIGTSCLCAAVGDYIATKSGDCCDSDGNVHPQQLTYFETANSCGDYDYNCYNGGEIEDPTTGGGCSGWSLFGNGCNRSLGWEGSAPPGCGEARAHVEGGCGYASNPLECDPPVNPTRVQKCR